MKSNPTSRRKNNPPKTEIRSSQFYKQKPDYFTKLYRVLEQKYRSRKERLDGKKLSELEDKEAQKKLLAILVMDIKLTQRIQFLYFQY